MSEHVELVAGNLIKAPTAPGEITIMPWGDFEVKGQKCRLCEDSIGLIQASMDAHGVDIPVDYEHGTSTNPPADNKAIAAGWITKIDAQPGRPLRASVEWTASGARHVAAKEFRYLSPTFFRRKTDGVVIGLHSVALTNKPAIAHMEPIAASLIAASAAAERTLAMKDIATCLGLAAEATQEQIVAKCKELVSASAEAKGLREATIVFASELGDEALVAKLRDGSVEVVSASLKTAAIAAKSPAGMVSASDYKMLAEEVKSLRQQQSSDACSALIAAHSNKLPPAKQEWFRKFYSADAVAAKEWIEQAPELVAASASKVTDPGKPTDRAAIIAGHRSKFASDESIRRSCSSERSYVNGQLIAASLAGISAEEAKSLALVG